MQKYANKQAFASLVSRQMYNLVKLTFCEIRAENIFAVESLVQALEKLVMVRELELNDCCTRFTDKFFSHFASRKLSNRYLPSLKTIKLKKVVMNQINMASEVFFDCFPPEQLECLEIEECFKAPPVAPNYGRFSTQFGASVWAQPASNGPRRQTTTQWN